MANVPPAISQIRGKKSKITSKSTSKHKGLFEGLTFGNISEKTIIDFTRGLAVMMKARLSLTEALDTAGEQAGDARFKSVLTQISSDVNSGDSLAKSLARHPKLFNSFYIHLVEVGEVAGILDQVLFRLADHMSKSYSLRKKVKMAMVYPGMVLTVATGAILFLLLVMVPTFADMYGDYGAELPDLTQSVLAVSQWLSGNIVLILLGIFLLIFGLRHTLKNPNVKYTVERIKLRIPIFGTLFTNTAVVRFCQTLGTLLKSEIRLLDGLNIISKASDNLLLQEATREMSGSIKKGGSLGSALKRSKLFPSIVLQMITVGEETAELDEMLLHLADHFSAEIDLSVESLTSIIEPLLIIVLGIILGFLIVAMYLPMFELMNVIQ